MAVPLHTGRHLHLNPLRSCPPLLCFFPLVAPLSSLAYRSSRQIPSSTLSITIALVAIPHPKISGTLFALVRKLKRFDEDSARHYFTQVCARVYACPTCVRMARLLPAVLLPRACRHVVILETPQVARGVQHMHTNNCVHRDLKLENIMFAGDNTLRIVDFGLACEIRDGGKLDLVCGSVLYVSGEP